MDLGSDAVARITGPNTSSWFGWDADNHLVAADRRDKTATTYRSDGSKVGEWGRVGDSVTTTPDGSTILFFTNDYADQPPPMDIVSNGDRRKINVAGTSGGPPMLAPDGHAFLLSAYAGGKELIIVSQ